MNRKPPADVRRLLRTEVGFGCPVPGCRKPYLEWHHFDPPWADRQHHDPNGMIAICDSCHKKADGGAWTKEQLRRMKLDGAARTEQVAGEFQWRRNRLLTFVGGQYLYEVRCPIVVQKEGPLICFNRDGNDCFLLNVRWPSFVDPDDQLMEDNFWTLPATPQDVECPPNGKSLKLIYDENRQFEIRFDEVEDFDSLSNRYVTPRRDRDQFLSIVQFPVTVVAINYVISNWEFELTPRGSKFAGMNLIMPGGMISNGEVGISFSRDNFSTP